MLSGREINGLRRFADSTIRRFDMTAADVPVFFGWATWRKAQNKRSTLAASA